MASGVIFSQPSRFSREIYKNESGDSLSYRLLFPDYSKDIKYPLVIFLHGSGERGNDNDAQLKWGVMNFASDQMMSMYPCFVIAPQCPANERWSKWGSDSKSWNKFDPISTKPMKLTLELIDDIIQKFPIDKNRIYITGLSMGGMGTFDLITRKPELFAAALPVCGAGDITMADRFKNIPVWIVHGSNDPAVDVKNSYNMANALVAAGANPGLTIYPEVGHFSWLQAYSDQLIMQWLFRQHK